MSLTYIRVYKNTDKNITKVRPEQSELIFYTGTHSIRYKVRTAQRRTPERKSSAFRNKDTPIPFL